MESWRAGYRSAVSSGVRCCVLRGAVGGGTLVRGVPWLAPRATEEVAWPTAAN